MRTTTGLTITQKGNRIIVETPEELRLKALRKEQSSVLKNAIFLLVSGFILGSLVTQYLIH